MRGTLLLQPWLLLAALLVSACSSSSPSGQSPPASATTGGQTTTGTQTTTGGPMPGGEPATTSTDTGAATGTTTTTTTTTTSSSGSSTGATQPGGAGDAGAADGATGDVSAVDAGTGTSPAYDGGAVINVSDAGDGEIMVGPTYTPSPYLTLMPGAPAGFTTSFTMSSTMSTIYNGSDFTPPLTFTRQITVFVPQQYVDGTASPFMVTSDGFYAAIQTVVQNLAGSADPNNSVPPLVVIGIENGPNVYPNSERSLEYDTVSDRYWRFVTQEVLPAVISNAALKAKFPNFALTSDPNGRGGYGCSSGGPAVMGLAWFGDFNRVFSFSGSFVAIQKTAAYPEGAWEYPQLIAAAPLRPNLRVFLEVGQNDNGSTTPATSDSNWVIANQNMAAALLAKGNHYRFIFANGAGHCDHAARNEVMPDGLVWLWRGYQATN